MATRSPSQSVPISNGPSKFDLMLALFDSRPPDRRWITFHVEEYRRETLDVHVLAVERKDGSCERWNFKGLVRFSEHYGGYCSGTYSTQDRKGTLTVEVEHL